MAIVIPVPGLGSVSVLTGSEDLVRVSCRSATEFGPAVREVTDGSLIAATCGTSRLALIAYLPDLTNLSLIQIIAALLTLSIEPVQLEQQETIFVAAFSG